MHATRDMRDTRGFAFESTLSKVARVLTGQYGVTVAFSPDGPRVEPGRIVIPDYELNGGIDRDVLIGYLDLLVARAKHASLAQLDALPSGVAANLAQMIEDRRVCGQLLDEYPGARWFIGKLRLHAAERVRQRWPKLHWRERLVWLVERALWDEAPTRTEASHSLLAALHAAQDLLHDARASRSTAQSIASAQALVARVRALSAGEVNSMAFTADALEDIDTETAASPSTPLDDDDTVLPDQDSANSPPSDRSGGAQADNAVGMGRSLADAQQPSERSEGEAASSAADASRARLSIPLATEFDDIRDLTGQGDSAAWRELRAQARADTAPLKEKLERALSADERTRWRREQERGEIDRTALAKLATSPGYRTPFRTQRPAKGRDVAVTLLIDRSGSMAGRKIELARQCAAALCDALTQLSFDCEVLGYCSVESLPMQQLYARQLAAGADLRRYNRFVERLDLKVYKRFGATDLSGIAAIDCGHENPDGEALAWAATRLADHPAERRILMMFSDGYPSTGDGDPQVLRSDLRERIAAIGKCGIELVGIGVLTDAVEDFYPHNVVVSRLAELPATVFSVLSSMLLAR
ncbi:MULTISPECIES: cobaltochelatase CobT-related protein [Paraburkholderia]|uniref:Nicotinate-mononucleotide:5, 6-dimethylbenzimidazole phosphoribosyltransferase CobT n=1 Tax=Paraburkholderia dioscoreae TaxID=2604047 RepID=A0A5Q4ZMF8_9BURK|nr:MULTISPECIES: cobalamin biosynthesis protein CobT [Paraburkholderia]MDR8401384.1 cobalamin biosynthesis protein CobT [Paraburkholderia sp. USG1]VVD33096.1 Nicotinate-mononucleotide:5, 6-dimethylbenzimidazole phosphoribosyltransferase CobT [Paraburkholderia dioscoreae]